MENKNNKHHKFTTQSTITVFDKSSLITIAEQQSSISCTKNSVCTRARYCDRHSEPTHARATEENPRCCTGLPEDSWVPRGFLFYSIKK